MEVLVQPIKQIVEVADNGGTVEIRAVKNVVDVTARGPQGPAGGTKIGGYPVDMANVSDNDVIIFQSQKWVNTQQSNITDGGNF